MFKKIKYASKKTKKKYLNPKNRKKYKKLNPKEGKKLKSKRGEKLKSKKGEKLQDGCWYVGDGLCNFYSPTCTRDYSIITKFYHDYLKNH